MTERAHDMSDAYLNYFPPPPDLQPYISLFYEFHHPGPVFEGYTKADYAQFRVHLRGHGGTYRFIDGTELVSPRVQIMGPTTGVTHIRTESAVHVFGAGILPQGWAQMVEFGAGALINSVIDVEPLFGKGMTVLGEAFTSAATVEERLELAIGAARRFLATDHRNPKAKILRAVDEWLMSSTDPQVDALYAMLPLSPRQIERDCRKFYGAAPKQIARKFRALRAATMIARGEATIADAIDFGFYDQSHMTREIRHFTGETPKKLTESDNLVGNLIMSRGRITGLNPLITDS